MGNSEKTEFTHFVQSPVVLMVENPPASAVYAEVCREPAREIPPMTRSCGEAWWARRVKPQSSPWNFLSMYPKNQNLPALWYCAFPLFWHTLEKVNSGLLSSAFERNVSVQTPSDNSLACLRDPYSCACELFSLPTPRGTGSLKHPRNAGTSKVSISLE